MNEYSYDMLDQKYVARVLRDTEGGGALGHHLCGYIRGHILKHTPKGTWWLFHMRKSSHMLEPGTARVRKKNDISWPELLLLFLGRKLLLSYSIV